MQTNFLISHSWLTKETFFFVWRVLNIYNLFIWIYKFNSANSTDFASAVKILFFENVIKGWKK